MPLITLIISYYKGIEPLKMILEALKDQSDKRFEVIISEDDHNLDTLKYVEEFRKKYSFPIHHVNQEVDQGFRKNIMLNKSILTSTTDHIVFIDGDCIPHKHFIKSYINNFEDNTILYGRRVNLGEKFTEKIIQKNKVHFSFISLLFSDSWKVKEGFYNPYFSVMLGKKHRGILGCNWGIKKQHLLDVNGFDNDYQLPAVGEDTDIEWRLLLNGLQMKPIKNQAIVYHLFHDNSRKPENEAKNAKMLEEKMNEKQSYCKNGLEQIKATFFK